MYPLKKLVFARYAHNCNSHKYRPTKKQLRELKTLTNRINSSWSVLNINTDIYSWIEDKQFYKDEDLIDAWIEDNKDIYSRWQYLHRITSFRTDSYHAPPQLRGLYAFPLHRMEPFLINWNNPTKYIINYNKPYLWCHFVKEAQTLNVAVDVVREWVLVASSDYLKVLAAYEKSKLKEIREWVGLRHGLIRNPYALGSRDEMEVFLL